MHDGRCLFSMSRLTARLSCEIRGYVGRMLWLLNLFYLLLEFRSSEIQISMRWVPFSRLLRDEDAEAIDMLGLRRLLAILQGHRL